MPCSNILNLSRKYGPALVEKASAECNRQDRTISLTGMRHRILAIRDGERDGRRSMQSGPDAVRDDAGGIGRVRGADACKRAKAGE